MAKNKDTKYSKYIKINRQRRWWKKLVEVLCCIVVFCTTYALILPAITVEKDAYCGFVEHEHSQECYFKNTVEQEEQYVCDYELLGVHVHTDECYDSAGVVKCGVADFVVHEHSSDCYDDNGTLVCLLPEIKAHSHTETCYSEENMNHSHDESCYEMVQTLACGLEETATDEEVVTDETVQTPNCGQTEIILHTHEESCYETYIDESENEQKRLVCGLIEIFEHIHVESCIEIIETPVEDVDVLTCAINETDDHTHSEMCYGTWKLTCDIPEHSHTDECLVRPVYYCGKDDHTHTEACLVKPSLCICGKVLHTHGEDCFDAEGTLVCVVEEHAENIICTVDMSALGKEERTEVENVILMIDALPAYEEVEEKFDEYDNNDDMYGYEAYYRELHTKCNKAYDAYEELSDEQKDYVPNLSKLMDLEWLWSVQMMDSNTGTIRESLDGDWAYITELKMVSDNTTTSGTYLRTGTAAWDADDSAGNDKSDKNNILRTFDTATYTIQFNTNLRESVRNEDVGGIKKGRLYFEFILPYGEDECRFETGSIAWLQTYPDVAYEVVTADVMIGGKTVSCQILRGSYTMTPTGTNISAIGASTAELNITIRAMQMHNGDTITPYFTLWLQHNDVGITYGGSGNKLPKGVVYGNSHACAVVDANGTAHGVEAQSMAGTTITVSARLMFNVRLTGVEARNTKVMNNDFNQKGKENAINYGIGQVYGRMNGYGISLELRGKTGQGMRGMAFPDEEHPITFDLKLSSSFLPDGGKETVDAEYLPLFWSGGQNSTASVASVPDQRVSSVANQYAMGVPYNSLSDKSGQGKFYKCEDGGTWTFAETDDASVISVKVSNFTFGTHFPTRSPAHSADAYYTSSSVGQDFWKIDWAVFSAGEVWLVQPFYNSKNKYVCDKYGKNGQFFTMLQVTNIAAYEDNGNGGLLTTTQYSTTDDKIHVGQYLLVPGSINGYLYYNQYGYRAETGILWNDFLTNGNDDSDWAAAGTNVRMQIRVDHDSAEGDFVGVAYDNFLKFDDEYFMPEYRTSNEYTARSNGVAYEGSHNPYKILYGGRLIGWIDDEEMKKATPDDLTWFESWDDCIKAGYTPMGILYEYRKVMNESGMNHNHAFLNGTIKADCEPGVYMIVRNTYAWRKSDVAEAALSYCNSVLKKGYTSVNELTNADYNSYVQSDAFISHRPGATNNRIYKEGSNHSAIDGFECKPFWYQDYYKAHNRGKITTTNGNPTVMKTSACKSCYKASYTDNVYKAGNGAPYYQDSCLVVGEKTSITKKTAQREAASSTTPKLNYDMGLNQRTVDYQIDVKLERSFGTNVASGAAMDTIMYVEDTLPTSLTYLDGSAYLGGTYTQDSTHQLAGEITGGQQFIRTSGEPTEGIPCIESVSMNANGTTTIRWAFLVHLDEDDTSWTGTIRFSCQIGTPGVESTDVKNGQAIENTAKVWSTGDSSRVFNTSYGNVSVSAIAIQKTSSFSLSNISEQLITDVGSDFGFSMSVGNISAVTKNDSVIVTALPYNGLHNSHFNGELITTEFSMVLVDADEDIQTSNFQFYYTTSPAYAGALGEYYREQLTAYQTQNPGADMIDWLNAQGNWNKLTFSDSLSADNMYSATNLPEGEQIVAIIAVGDLPANQTLNMHITMDLPEGEAGDYLVSYLSQEKLLSYARSQVVSRNLDGLTWMDLDEDGIQDNNEPYMSGVKVTLLKLKNNGNPKNEADYEIYHYQNDPTLPVVVIETGQQVNVRTGSTETVAGYESGRYRFADLPEGTYAVKFENGNEVMKISIAKASPVNQGSNEEKDSDGVATYTSDGKSLEYTIITGIVMPKATVLTNYYYEAAYNDSGFYGWYELPSTGGSGTAAYITVGVMLVLISTTYFIYVTKKRKRNDG